MRAVLPEDGSRLSVVFFSCRSICQSEDEDEAQHRNCTIPQMQKNIDKLQTTAGLSRQVQCIIGLFASAPRTTTLDRQFTQIQRMHVGYFYFLPFTGTTQHKFVVGWFNHFYLRRPITDICAPLPRSTVELHLAKVMLKHDEKV